MTVRWVLGVDGSDGAEHALRWCVSQAPNRAEVIHLVRAWRPMIISANEIGTQVLTEEPPPAAYHSIDELNRELDGLGIGLETTVEFGGASAVLLDAADQADLLVVGARGLGGFKRLLLGSVSYQCATHARVPVCVVPSDARLDRLNSVVVGMDGSRNAKAALRWALDFGPNTEVRVVGAWIAPPMITRGDEERLPELAELAERLFNDAIDDVVGAERDADMIRREFLHADAAHALMEAGTAADLVVVGERGQSGITAAVLGSVTTRVLHHAPSPVVVVPQSTVEP